MSSPKFAETHNLVAFLEKPEESNGFEGIIDFLNASSIKYALTVNPTVYESCIEQFWTTAKVKTVNGERQIQALVDKKKVIITETSIRSDLKLDDAEAWNEFSSTMASAIICLATNQKFNFSKYIFDNMIKNLEGGVKFLMYPRFVQVFLDKQVKGMSKHNGIYVISSHTKKVFANMKREGKGFSGRVTPLFQSVGFKLEYGVEDSAVPTDSHSTPIITQPSSSNLKEKVKKKTEGKDSGLSEMHSTGCGRLCMTKYRSYSLVTRPEGGNDEEMLFDVDDDLQGEEVAEKEISTADPVTTAAKPKAVTTDAITITIRPKAKGVVIEEPSETTTTKTITTRQPSSKDKGNGKMACGGWLEELQRESDAQEEASRATVIEELDNIQAMIEVDGQLAVRL
ncbi:hypothetical protein Tco_0996118 [Tanacetum coccineum]